MADSRGTLLTIDCDWAVTPTPLRDGGPGADASGELEATLEHVRYPYAARPDDIRHRMSRSPEALLEKLRDLGLPRRTRAALTERHGELRLDWSDALAAGEHIVCLDAHLDMYAIGSLAVTLSGPDGVRRRQTFAPSYREMAAGMPALAQHQPAVAAPVRAAAWEQAWALLLLERMPRLRRFTWVVPDHFAPALAAGFPYPHAQWLRTLQAGHSRGIWDFDLDPSCRRITLILREPELAGRRLAIDVVTLAECPSLAGVDAHHIHLCRSPAFLPPSADSWVDDLAALLNPAR